MQRNIKMFAVKQSYLLDYDMRVTGAEIYGALRTSYLATEENERCRKWRSPRKRHQDAGQWHQNIINTDEIILVGRNTTSTCIPSFSPSNF